MGHCICESFLPINDSMALHQLLLKGQAALTVSWYGPDIVVQPGLSQHTKTWSTTLNLSHLVDALERIIIREEFGSKAVKSLLHLPPPKELVCNSFHWYWNGASFSAARLTARKILYLHIRWVIAYKGGDSQYQTVTWQQERPGDSLTRKGLPRWDVAIFVFIWHDPLK